MRRFRLLLDPSRNQFKWPVQYPRTDSYSKDILIQYRTTFGRDTDPYIKADVARRDQVFEKDDKRRRAGITQAIASLFRSRRTPGLLQITPAPTPEPTATA